MIFKSLIGLKNNNKSLTLHRKELENTYLSSILSSHVYSSKNYPFPFFLKEKNIYAYNLYFMSTIEKKEAILDVILTNFNVQETNEYRQAKGINDLNESIHFSISPEFNGYSFQIVTNSLVFLEQLDLLKIEPPPPWIVFPEIDPDTLGSLQGSIDYWWYVYWTPFWQKLSTQEKQEYYNINNASPEWIECIDIHN